MPSVLGNTFDPAHLHRLGSQALGGTRSPCPGADHSARACPQGSRPFLVQEAPPPRARLERFWIQVQDLVTASLWKLWKSHTVLQKGYDFGARRSVFTRSRMTSTGICKGGGRLCGILKREGEREGERERERERERGRERERERETGWHLFVEVEACPASAEVLQPSFRLGVLALQKPCPLTSLSWILLLGCRRAFQVARACSHSKQAEAKLFAGSFWQSS